MKDYRDIKKMKTGGHVFMADGGFTGSAGVQSVKPYVRKPKTGKPSKPDFVRRATTPGGLANCGMAPKASSEVTLAAGSYAKGGKADMKQDKVMVKKAVHRHEKVMHPGKPLTPMKRGGLSTYSRKPMVGC
jgi:hypothetical protein